MAVVFLSIGERTGLRKENRKFSRVKGQHSEGLRTEGGRQSFLQGCEQTQGHQTLSPGTTLQPAPSSHPRGSKTWTLCSEVAEEKHSFWDPSSRCWVSSGECYNKLTNRNHTLRRLLVKLLMQTLRLEHTHTHTISLPMTHR